MFFDNQLQLSTAQAVTTTAASTTIFDVTGAGSGNAPTNLSFGNATIFGDDIGAGDGTRPVAVFSVGTAFAGGTSIVFSVQAAIDNGSNSPSTYVTLTETAVVPVANLTAGAQFQLVIPPIPGGALIGLPRFYRFNYTVVGTMSAGTITAGIVLNPTNTLISRVYPENFTAV